MPRLYMIGIRWAEPLLALYRTENVDLAVAGLGEWLRYNGDTWLVLADVDAMEVSNRVRPALNTGDNIMVLPIDPIANVGGWAPTSVWDFVGKRSQWTLGNVPRNALGGSAALGGDTGPPGTLGEYMRNHPSPFGPDEKK